VGTDEVYIISCVHTIVNTFFKKKKKKKNIFLGVYQDLFWTYYYYYYYCGFGACDRFRCRITPGNI